MISIFTAAFVTVARKADCLPILLIKVPAVAEQRRSADVIWRQSTVPVIL